MSNLEMSKDKEQQLLWLKQQVGAPTEARTRTGIELTVGRPIRSGATKELELLLEGLTQANEERKDNLLFMLPPSLHQLPILPGFGKIYPETTTKEAVNCSALYYRTGQERTENVSESKETTQKLVQPFISCEFLSDYCSVVSVSSSAI